MLVLYFFLICPKQLPVKKYHTETRDDFHPKNYSSKYGFDLKDRQSMKNGPSQRYRKILLYFLVLY